MKTSERCFKHLEAVRKVKPLYGHIAINQANVVSASNSNKTIAIKLGTKKYTDVYYTP